MYKLHFGVVLLKCGSNLLCEVVNQHGLFVIRENVNW